MRNFGVTARTADGGIQPSGPHHAHHTPRAYRTSSLASLPPVSANLPDASWRPVFYPQVSLSDRELIAIGFVLAFLTGVCLTFGTAYLTISYFILTAKL